MFQLPWKNFKRFLSKMCKQPFYSSKVLLKRIEAYFFYCWANGKAGLPESVTIFLTHRCNLRCKMCGQWGEGGVTKEMDTSDIRQELKFSELKNLIDGISCFMPNVTLFGGEPLLYSDCAELIRYIKNKKMHCLMITNGSMLENIAQDIVNSGLDELNVSLDGLRELHNQIRGLPGLFEKITNGLREINRAKKEKGLKRPLINLQCTITKYNYKQLRQLIDVAKEIEANSLTYHNLIFLGKDLIDKQKEFDKLLSCSSIDWEGFVFEPEIEPERLYAEMQEILLGNYPFSVDFYPNLSLNELKEYYNNPYYVPKEYPARCISPWVVAYIFPDGEVRPCLNFNYSYGNIKEHNFRELWNNEKAVSFRRTLKTNQIFPVCVRCTELYRY